MLFVLTAIAPILRAVSPDSQAQRRSLEGRSPTQSHAYLLAHHAESRNCWPAQRRKINSV